MKKHIFSADRSRRKSLLGILALSYMVIPLLSFHAISQKIIEPPPGIIHSCEPDSDWIDDPNTLYLTVEEMPQFPGGEFALQQFIEKNLQYPAGALKDSVQGRVSCQFIVEKDGSLSKIEVTRSKDPRLSKEAIRIISKMPKFIPAKQRGHIVRCIYIVVVTFKIPGLKTETDPTILRIQDFINQK